MANDNKNCNQCWRRLYSKPIVGIAGQDVPSIVGKSFCNMNCADEYLARNGKELKTPLP